MALLEVRNLSVVFDTPAGSVQAVNGLSFSLEKGEVLGIVGESGSGKSVTAYSILQLLEKNGRITGGSVVFDGVELLGAGQRVLQNIRGNRISMIFQDPMTSLNPTATIGYQLTEPLLLHTRCSRGEANRRAVEMLRMVGVSAPQQRMKQYPHSLSGGMRQRVMIAMSLICQPDILIADEPTTALDVTIQAQILELMERLRQDLGTAILMITHDLGVVAQLCHRVMVMYGGTVCEQGPVEEIFHNPRHAYTRGLLRAMPTGQRGRPIPGSPIDLLQVPQGCPFSERCEDAMQICLRQRCALEEITPGHKAACWLNEKGRKEDEGKLH